MIFRRDDDWEFVVCGIWDQLLVACATPVGCFAANRCYPNPKTEAEFVFCDECVWIVSTSRTPTSCDLGLLRRSLGDVLTEAQEETLASHLSECDACRQELERLAAEGGDWSKISDVLKLESDSGTSFRPSGELVPHEFDDEFVDDLTADFAVDFLAPASSPSDLGQLGDISIQEIVGRGGMGIVLKGYQPELKRLVAVKVLAPHLAVSGAARRRFAREAQAAAAILHPNVMPILTVHSSGRLPYLVMPYLASESLQQRINAQGVLELADLLRIGIQTAQGLAAAHAQGIVHRDVKPANILLEPGVNRVMLTDFGLARAIDDANVTRSGVIAGTPQYMSPEQARGEPLDARTDLFSLGSVLYAMATGRPPFRAESTFGILRRITDDPHRPMSEINSLIPRWFEKIVDKLLAKSATDRFRSAEEVAQLLEQCLVHLQQPAVAALPEFVRPKRRLRISLVIGALLIAGIVIALVVGQRVWPPKDHLISKEELTREPLITLPEQEDPTESQVPDWDELESDFQALIINADKLEAQVNRDWDRDLNADQTLTPTTEAEVERQP